MVTMHDINAAAREIVRQFKPKRITLFGSYAHGDATEDSDVDFLVLMNGRRVHDLAIQIRRAINFGFPVDLVVRSPAEFERRIHWGDFFLKEIQDRGKILYEASDARVGAKGRRGFPHRATRTTRKKVTQL